MRDFRKFCRPKIKNTSSIGDIILKLKCGTTGTISQEEYNKVKQFFKLESFVGESTSSPGKIKAESKLLGEEAIFDIATYQIIEDSFEIKEIIGDKKTPADGDIICHNSILNRDATFSFLDWLNVDDSWEITGLYNIETFEEEDAQPGYNIIMANGTTLIIKPEDYSKVSNNWEIVDTIEEPRVVAKFNVTDTSNPVNLWAGYELNIIKSIEVDGILLNGTPTTYTFTTTGNHIVKYELYDNTKLGNNAPLFYNGNLVECIIPDSVITIGNNAFNSCTGLTSINIPDSVTTIGSNVFDNCTSLTSVTIGSGVTSIGSQTLANTEALKVLNYNAKCELSTYIKGNWPNLETVIIGDSTPSIGYQAFYGCSSLTNVTIGRGVTSIGAHVFKDCSSLTSITSLATTAPTIDNSAFQNVKTGGTLTVPTNSTGYDTWMQNSNYYLGLYNWTKVEQ